MTPRKRQRTSRWLPVVLSALVVVCSVGCGDEVLQTPDLLPLDATTVTVNDTLRLTLTVQNSSGVSLEYSHSGPSLPGLSEVTDLSGTPSGGEFRWTPLASHVGTHELTFTITFDGGTDSETVLITVASSASAAPIFLRPGAGGTFDLSRDPRVRFDIEVRDDDSSEVDLRFVEAPAGGNVIATGPKVGHFEWYPTVEQTDESERWTVVLEADDRDHEPTLHEYLIVLRTAGGENCEGDPPSITITSPGVDEHLTSAAGYPVVATITDDVGIRDEPILYYTTVAPDDPSDLDILSFEQTTFKKQDSGDFQAEVPPFTLGEGEERIIYYVVSVTDNDDPDGTSCDHRTETPLRQFVAVGASSTVLAEECDACGKSADCDTGICATTESGGRCLPPCSGGSCELGACIALTDVGGGVVQGCGDYEAVCEEPPVTSCTDDSYEENDAQDTATAFPGASLTGTLCPGDDDFYQLNIADASDLTATLTGFDVDVDLDLQLIVQGGSTVGSYGLTDTEERTISVADGAVVFVRVFSLFDDRGSSAYSLSYSLAAACENDDDPADSQDSPQSPDEGGGFDGMICPSDSDYYSISMSEAGQIEVYVTFVHSDVNIKLDLYDPDGSIIASANGTTDEETIAEEVGAAGTYLLRVSPTGDGAGEYVGEITLTLGCLSTDGCDSGFVCDTGDCVSDVCSNQAGCPDDHTCPTSGPDWGASHCAAPCSVNGDCRTGEACKWLTDTVANPDYPGPGESEWMEVGVRGCAVRGDGANGTECTTFQDCGGQRTCVDFPDGYCARAGCTTNADCDEFTGLDDVFCDPNIYYDYWFYDDLGICVRVCGDGEPDCRTGYTCEERTDASGGTVTGCVPY